MRGCGPSVEIFSGESKDVLVEGAGERVLSRFFANVESLDQGAFGGIDKAEDVTDHAIEQRFSLQIVDDLVHFNDDGAVGGVREGDGIDVGIEHGPLAGPVFADTFVAMDMTALHAVGPYDVGVQGGEHSVDVAGVEAIVEMLEDVYPVRHGGSVERLIVAAGWRGRGDGTGPMRGERSRKASAKLLDRPARSALRCAWA